jgi:hypothetical protein
VASPNFEPGRLLRLFPELFNGIEWVAYYDLEKVGFATPLTKEDFDQLIAASQADD